MSWIELKLKLPPEKMEDISGYLFAQGCEGININDDGVTVYFSQHRWTDEIKLGIIEYIQEFFPSFTARDLKVINIPDQDWNKNWKEFFKPTRVTTRVVVQPPWEEHRRQMGDIALTINPKMAFGTGHHESTKLMIMAMEDRIRNGMHVLDIGTGSGILAILAEKLGAEMVVAIDNDPQAIRNAQENARLNRAKKKIIFLLGQPENLQPSEYDLILANLNREILLKYAGDFSAFLKPGGNLIVSGILRRDAKAVNDAMQKAGFVRRDQRVLKDWMSIVFELKTKKNDVKKNQQQSENQTGF